jgi:DNA-binding IclR family transcriptional regulator
LRTLAQTDAIIDAICEDPSGIRVLNISRRTKIAPATVSRYLRAMHSLNWLDRNTRKGAYELSGKLPALFINARKKYLEEAARLKRI